MTSSEPKTEDLRAEAARLAFTLLRFASAAGHPLPGSERSGVPKVGSDAWVFGPSWQKVPSDGVEAFLTGLPSRALLNPNLIRGEVTLLLLDELTGERRRWGEKTLSNLVACFDEMVVQLALPNTAKVLVEFDDESHVFSLGAVREWARTLAVNVGWNLAPLAHEECAEACLMLIRADDREFPGRSCMMRERYRRQSGAV